MKVKHGIVIFALEYTTLQQLKDRAEDMTGQRIGASLLLMAQNKKCFGGQVHGNPKVLARAILKIAEGIIEYYRAGKINKDVK